MLNRLLSTFGVGSATVDTKLHQEYLIQGGTIEGVVEITGGNLAQQVDSIYLKLMTIRMDELDGKKIEVPVEVFRYTLTDAFMVEPREFLSFPFKFKVPFDIPMTRSKSKVWLQTGLDVDKAIDPTDKDYVQVAPAYYLGELIRAFENLGFHWREVENKKAPRHFSTDSGLVQEIEFVAGDGQFLGKFDEVEVWVAPHSAQWLEVMFEMDKKTIDLKSAIQESLGLDEGIQKRLSITPHNIHMLKEVLYDLLSRA